MIDFDALKAGIEDGSINERNIDDVIKGLPGFRLSVLKWLSDAGDGITSIASGTPAAVQRTATTTLATTNGSVAAGSKSVVFGVSADFSGTIDGVAVDPDNFASVPYVAPNQDTLEAIAYTVAAGSLLIVRIS